MKKSRFYTTTVLASVTFAMLSAGVVAAKEPTKIPLPKDLPSKQQVVKSSVKAAKNERVTAATTKTDEKAVGETSPLRKALAEAYLHNPQLEAQRKAQNVIDERVPQALSGALPTASLGYEKGRRKVHYSGQAAHQGNAETKSLSVVQPLFQGGTTLASTQAARQEVKAGQARLHQAEQEILNNTVVAYMDVVQSQSVVELSKKNLSVLEKQQEASQQRFNVGEDTKTDVAQSQARVASARSQLTESEGQLAARKAAFRRFIGYDAKDIVMPSIPEGLPASLEEAIQLALVANPKVLEATHLKKAADYAVNAHVGRLLPSVNLRGSMSRQDGAGVDGRSKFDQDDVMLAVSIPLFQAGAEYSRVREAKETYQQRRFSEMDTSDAVRQQVVNAWESWQASKASVVSDQAAIDAARIALSGVKQEQQYGARTTLDVLDAERELFNAEVKHTTSRRDEVVAAYGVLASVGKLTAQDLELKTPLYDPNKHFDDVEYQFIGF
jgi:outer membrane protein